MDSSPLIPYPRPVTTTFPSIGQTVVTFSPNGDAETLVVAAIDAARLSLCVQAYEFSSKPICDAVLRAKSRGVMVKVLLDKANRYNPLSKWFNTVGRNSLYPALKAAGVSVLFDTSPTIAHSKVVVVDATVVVTGSFNFSAAAQKTNAENLLVITDASVAKLYLQNFAWRASLSKP